MGKPWGRLYAGTRNHRKIKLLAETFPNHWMCWYVLIELAIECDDNGWIYIAPDEPYSPKQIGKEIGIHRKDVAERFLNYLESPLKLIQKSDKGILLLSFVDRNFISDVSTSRVKKYREKQKTETANETLHQRFGNVSETDQNRTDTEHIKKPPISPKGGDNGFDKFWSAYPKKKGKKEALRAWQRARDKPNIDKILASIGRQCLSHDWTKSGGQYIPHPATWINQGRWDDEVDAEPKSEMDAYMDALAAKERAHERQA